MKKEYDKNILKKLKRKIKIYKIASFDIETETETGYNNFLQGGFIDATGKYKSFWNRKEMIEYMLKHTDKDTKIYATKNVFDYSALFKDEKEYMQPKPNMRGTLLIHCEYKHLNFHDTLAYCKASVEQLGKMLGKEKIKYNLKENKIYMPKWKRDKLVRYNKRDCEVTREFMIGFQKVMNEIGGELKNTIGGCAIDLFRRKYLEENIHHEYCKYYKFKNGMTFKEMLFASYHGGRAEIFKRGSDNKHIYKKYDFNSTYTSAMLNKYPKPSSCHVSESKKGLLDIKQIINYEGISECDVIIPYMYYPILPCYINDKLCFPIGKLEHQFFTHAELREFLKIDNKCKILKIYKTIIYTKIFTPFTKWVNEVYAIRLKFAKEGNIIYKEIIKLLLNNIYGKFGQNNIKDNEWKRTEERNDNDISQEGFTWNYEIGMGYREIPKESNQGFVIPIFAVYTTAYARIKLWKKLIKLKGIYIDTDSVITTRNIKSSSDLGELKLEGKYSEINIAKEKHYKHKDKNTKEITYHIKGLRMAKNEDKKLEDIEREQQFEDSIDGKNIKQIHIISPKEAMRTGHHINQVIFTTKKFDLRHNKRIWIKPYNKELMQDSEPLICGFNNLKELNNYFNS